MEESERGIRGSIMVGIDFLLVIIVSKIITDFILCNFDR